MKFPCISIIVPSHILEAWLCCLWDVVNDFETAFVSDPNVDVIYVSSVPMSNELMQYYSRLVGLKPAVDSGNSDDQSDLSDRYTVIVPDAIHSFPVRVSLLPGG